MTIINVIHIVIGVLMIILSLFALNAKKLIRSVIYLSLLSMLAVVSFTLMRAPDVAITEAVIGSGLVTVLFVFTLVKSRKERSNV